MKKRMKATRKQKLAVAVGCLLLSHWLQVPVGLAEEQPDKAVITEEVDVTDTRLKERQAIQKTEITSEDIKAQGAANAAQALEKAAGVTVNANNSSGKKSVSLRGSDANNTKVFIDGVPLSPVGNGVVDLSNIPADSIERIEIIKGAAPVQYGSDAAGGVINIITKKGGKAGGSLSVASGSWNSWNYGTSISGGDKKANYFLSLKQEASDGFTRNSEKEAKYYNGKVNFELNPKSSVSLFGAYSKKFEELPNRYDPETGVLITNPGDSSMIGDTGKNVVDFWTGLSNLRVDPVVNRHSGFTFNHQFSDSSAVKLSLYKSSESIYRTGNNQAASSAGYLVGGGQNEDGSVRGYQLEHVLKTSPVNTVTWGYNHETRDYTQITDWFNDQNYTNTMTKYRADAQYSYQNNSYFIQNSLKLGKLTADAGYRHNDVQDHLATKYSATLAYYYQPMDMRTDYSSSNPTAGFRYALTDSTALHGSIGKSFRYPLPTEQASAAVASAAGLKPEETLNRELGVAHTTPAGLDVDVTFYNKQVDNLIQYRYYGSQLIPANLAETVTMKGFEAELSQKIGANLRMFLQFTKTQAVNPDLGRQVNDVPETKYSLGLNYTGNNGLNAMLALTHVGSRFSQFSNGIGGRNDSVTETINLPPYDSVDLKLSKELKSREYYIKFNNLFDKKFYSGAYLIAPGRYVEFGTDIKF